MALEATKCCSAQVLGAPRGPSLPLLNIRIGTGGLDLRSKVWIDTPFDGVSLEFGQGNWYTGELLVAESRDPRAGRNRESVLVRVVGDDAFGWAEAANACGVTVEVLVQLGFNNHRVSKLFGLPKSCICDTTIRRF